MRRSPPSPQDLGLGLLVLAAATLLVLRLGMGDERAEQPAQATVARNGAEQVVFDWSEDACVPEQYPDLPTRALRMADGGVRLILSHYANYSMVGPDLDSLEVSCDPLLASNESPDPSQFDDRRWLAALWSEDGREVLALVHEEFQGHRHPGRCPSGVYQLCWYNAITLARSSDQGATFQQPDPRDSLVASSPYRYVPDVGPVGLFSPSNIVTGPDGAFYALALATERGAQQHGSCLLRTEDVRDPHGWRAWDGSSFSVEFADPYQEPPPDPAAHVCSPVGPGEIAGMHESLTYNEHLGAYVLVGLTGAEDPKSGESVTGVYFSTSEDLIEWTRRKLLFRATSVQSFRCGGPDPIAYPSLVDPASQDPTFSTTGRDGYLFFTRFHYQGCEPTSDRDLVRIPVRIEAERG